MIELKNITKKFNMGKPNELTALDNINLAIGDGEMLAVMGRSGSGKSTLLSIIGCIDGATSGNCLIDGQDTNGLSESGLAKMRNRKIGILLQDFGLVGSETALQNVKTPLYFSKKPLRQAKPLALKALKLAGVENLAKQKVSTMSGGQKQRVALARAVVNSPRILLCDEPTGALDSTTAKEIMEQISALNHGGMTVVIVTHDPKVAACCKKTIFLNDGKISETERAAVNAE